MTRSGEQRSRRAEEGRERRAAESPASRQARLASDKARGGSGRGVLWDVYYCTYYVQVASCPRKKSVVVFAPSVRSNAHPQDLSRAASKAVGLTRFAFACSLLLAGYGPSSASGTVGLFRGRSPGSYVALRVSARVAEVRGGLVGAA